MADKLATEADLALVLEEKAEARLKTLALEMATGEVQNYTRQKIIRVDNDVVRLRGTWRDTLFLPQRPVLAVDLVKIGTPPVVVSAAGYSWNPFGELVRGNRLGEDSVLGYWGGPKEVVEVTYDHGFEQTDIPQDIRAVTIALAKRMIESGAPITSERIGSYGVSYDTGGAGLTDDEKHTLNRYRPTAYSVWT